MATPRGVDIRVDGAERLLNNINSIKGSKMRSIARTAITKACRPIVRAAKRNAPRDSGLLRRSIIQVVRTYQDTVFGVVGPAAGVKETVPRTMWAVEGDGPRFSARTGRPLASRLIRKVRMVMAIPALYAHLVEKGTRPHAIGQRSALRQGRQGGATHPGTKGTFFMKRAWESTRAEAQAIINREVAAGLRKVASK